jgi:hypothetical protein
MQTNGLVLKNPLSATTTSLQGSNRKNVQQQASDHMTSRVGWASREQLTQSGCRTSCCGSTASWFPIKHKVLLFRKILRIGPMMEGNWAWSGRGPAKPEFSRMFKSDSRFVRSGQPGENAALDCCSNWRPMPLSTSPGISGCWGTPSRMPGSASKPSPGNAFLMVCCKGLVCCGGRWLLASSKLMCRVAVHCGGCLCSTLASTFLAWLNNVYATAAGCCGCISSLRFTAVGSIVWPSLVRNCWVSYPANCLAHALC